MEVQKKIEQLREAVQDVLSPYYDTDWNLLRWLQGHDSNLDVILPKLRNHLTFRRLWNLDRMADGDRNHSVHHYWQVSSIQLKYSYRIFCTIETLLPYFFYTTETLLPYFLHNLNAFTVFFIQLKHSYRNFYTIETLLPYFF